MLNYVWLVLILLGVGSALTYDLSDNINDKYKNGKEIECLIIFQNPADLNNNSFSASLFIPASSFNKIYKTNEKSDIKTDAQFTYSKKSKEYIFTLKTDSKTPLIWQKIAASNNDENDISGQLTIKGKRDSLTSLALLTTEKVSFLKMRELTKATLGYANTAVEIVLGLIGIMALWLGIMKIAEESGIIKYIAFAAKPLMKFLFPSLPPEHPAAGAIIMNISATVLGLGNAATPFGIKAMEELNKLNDKKDTATDAMIMFMVLNTASFALMPTTAIALRAATGSSEPAIIIGTTMFGSFFATLIGVSLVKLFQNFPKSVKDIIILLKSTMKFFAGLLGLGIIVTILYFTGITKHLSIVLSGDLLKNIIQIISILAIPAMIAIFVIYGAFKKVKIYETFVEGAKEGFQVAVTIIPYLVAILVGIGIFRVGGAMEWLIYVMRPATDLIGMPVEVVPMALMRPLSGSGSLGIMAEIMKVHGPDSFIGILASTMFGSTETTFYVLAVYFGAVNIKKTRYALAAGLLSDLAGFLAAIFIVRLLFFS